MAVRSANREPTGTGSGLSAPATVLLLVDPDTRSARVLEVSLKKAGFAVNTAATGSEALAKARMDPPQLLLCEADLPDMDGFELAQRLRRELVGLGIVFLSQRATPEVKVQAINAGADDFVAKPVLVKDIVARVRNLLERQQTDALTRRDRPGNLSGTLATMGVVDLLQVMESGKKTGIIHLSSDPVKSGGFVAEGTARGTVFFRDGQAVDARLGKRSGLDALYRMLLWEDGVFEIEFKPISRDDSIRTPTQHMLLEGMRRVDEWTRLSDLLPSLRTRLVVDYAALARAMVSSEERPLLQLFDGRRSLLEVIDDAALEDTRALEIVARMYGEGVLVSEGGSRLESRPSAPADDLPSHLGRVMIPSPRSASEIMRAEDPLHRFDDEPVARSGGSTVVPEPLPEPSVVLSRHTVPANKVVELSRPAAPADPIPLTQRSTAPRIARERVSSVVVPSTRQAPARSPSVVSRFEGSEPARPALPRSEAPRMVVSRADTSQFDGHREALSQPSMPAYVEDPTPFEEPTPTPMPVVAPATVAPATVAPAMVAPATIAPAMVAPATIAPPRSMETAPTLPPEPAKSAFPVPQATEPYPAPARPVAAQVAAFGAPPKAEEGSGLNDKFFDKKDDDDLWGETESPWRRRLPALALVATTAGVIAAVVSMGPQQAPVVATPPDAGLVRVVSDWPQTNQTEVVIGAPDASQSDASSDDVGEATVGEAMVAAPTIGAATDAGAMDAVVAAAPPPPTPPVTKMDAEAMVAKASESFEKGKLNEARKLYQDATTQFPESAAAHAGLALVQAELGNDRAAKASAYKALQLDKAQADAYLVQGLVASNEGDNAAAKRAYQAYLKYAPTGKNAAEVRRVLQTLP